MKKLLGFLLFATGAGLLYVTLVTPGVQSGMSLLSGVLMGFGTLCFFDL
jgi:hypothetical protein